MAACCHGRTLARTSESPSIGRPWRLRKTSGPENPSSSMDHPAASETKAHASFQWKQPSFATSPGRQGLWVVQGVYDARNHDSQTPLTRRTTIEGRLRSLRPLTFEPRARFRINSGSAQHSTRRQSIRVVNCQDNVKCKYINNIMPRSSTISRCLLRVTAPHRFITSTVERIPQVRF